PGPPAKGGDGVGRLPFVTFNASTRQVRVEAETLEVDTPLEFFAVVFNGPEHEAVIRSKVKPSDLHTALLAVGLKPGSPVSYSEALNKWSPPHGPPLQIMMEFEKDGRTVAQPANRWMRNVKTKKPMPTTTWIFAGSRVMPDGNYAADSTGYLVSVVNFDMTVIDIPELKSKENEFLEWERDPDNVPPAGTKVTMVIQPAGKAGTVVGTGLAAETGADGEQPAAAQPGGAPAAEGDSPPAGDERPVIEDSDVDPHISDVKLDEALVERATKRWESVVGPRGEALRKAAQAHYDVINSLRREQQRLIDEADRVQRAIDRLERQYQDMTTPQPDLDGDGVGDSTAEPPADAPPEDATPDAARQEEAPSDAAQPERDPAGAK
ncbi:MAG: hypothetical protein AVDCRST_MAG64-505, partial [uncultured Phycisphaerae bacterium]